MRPAPLLTILSKNYLAHARTLAHSYLAHHPQGQVFVCLVDKVDGDFDPHREPFQTFLAEDLGIPNWSAFSFRYNIVELNTAVKPFALAHLLRDRGLDHVVYLDPDIVVYHSLHELDHLLDRYSVVLTPHILQPASDSEIDLELRRFRYGMCNLGFVAVSRQADLDGLLIWWQRRLSRYCTYDPSSGLFLDQKWMDLAPSLFPGIHMWRDPACNVAWWNFAQRPITCRDGAYVIGESPLKFVHFSGFTVERSEQVTLRNERFSLSGLSEATQALMRDYRERLLRNGYETVRRLAFAYEVFDDGSLISDAARRLYRQLDPAGERWPNPYETGPGTFFELWNSPRRRVIRFAKALLGAERYDALRSLVYGVAGRSP
jgi:hypothetical protein